MNVAARVEKRIRSTARGDPGITALDDLMLSFEARKVRRHHGPLGLEARARFSIALPAKDSLTGGRVYIGDVALDELSDKELTLRAARRWDLSFQSFNQIPTLDAAENITRFRSTSPEAAADAA